MYTAAGAAISQPMASYRWISKDNYDKPCVASDPATGALYLVATLYSDEDSMADLVFFRSSDYGQTWQGAGSAGPGAGLGDIPISPGAQIAVREADRSIHACYIDGDQENLWWMTSTDAGATFASPRAVCALPGDFYWPENPVPGISSDAPNGFRAGTIPSLAVTEAGGIAIARHGQVPAGLGGPDGVLQVQYVVSGDNGSTWSGLQPVTPRGLSSAGQHQLMPVAADQHGGESWCCACYSLGAAICSQGVTSSRCA